MPRKKAKPTIEEQLRAIISQALEEGRLDLAKSLIEVIRAMGTTWGTGKNKNEQLCKADPQLD
jgi:hypothetical protein